ncbi:MAG: hypothetical protein ABJL67_22505 [Sulfitobacter sp.]
MVPFALLGLAFLFLSIVQAAVFGWVSVLALGISIVFGGSAAFFFGIAWRRPVALRLDRHGISGFYTPPATWDEITDIGIFKDTNHNRFLGFALRDPIGFRDRQTAWGRLKSHFSNRSFGYHIIVPDIILQDADVETIAEQAKAFHTAATDAEIRPPTASNP